MKEARLAGGLWSSHELAMQIVNDYGILGNNVAEVVVAPKVMPDSSAPAARAGRMNEGKTSGAIKTLVTLQAQDIGNRCRGLGYGLRLRIWVVSFIRAAGCTNQAARPRFGDKGRRSRGLRLRR